MGDDQPPIETTDSSVSPAPRNTSAGWHRWVFGRNRQMTLVRILVLTVATAILFRVILLPIRVTGQSMQPTYRDGSINFINTLSYLRKKPQRGEVVAVLTRQGEVLLKRIVGLPGEQISLRQGHIYINDEPLNEPYAFSRIFTKYRGTQLGPRDYFLVGDNRPITAMGVVTLDQILGRVIF